MTPQPVSSRNITSRNRSILKNGLYMLLPQSNRVNNQMAYFNKKVAVQVLAAPPISQGFIQCELVIQPGGATRSVIKDELQTFCYVLEGQLNLSMLAEKKAVKKGGFAWLPPRTEYGFENSGQYVCRMLWIRCRYEVVDGIKVPEPILSHESAVPSLVTDTYLEKHLTPYEDVAFDMGINLQIFEPGVYFSDVEAHIMEHGLYMVSGGGVYWLNGDYMETEKDDFIYMAPYCPQFYYATGWETSSYLLYKDVNRDFVSRLGL